MRSLCEHLLISNKQCVGDLFVDELEYPDTARRSFCRLRTLSNDLKREAFCLHFTSCQTESVIRAVHRSRHQDAVTNSGVPTRLGNLGIHTDADGFIADNLDARRIGIAQSASNNALSTSLRGDGTVL